MFSFTRSLIFTALILAGLTIVSGAHGTSIASAASQPTATAAAPVLADLNRADCDAIRGTDYLSDEERSWFLSYCVGGGGSSTSYASPQLQPQVVYVYVPVPVAAAAPVAPSRPVAPSIRVTCSSSQGTAAVTDDLQNAPMNAFSGEPIYCTAGVNGSYTSIDWNASSNNGSGPNFTTSFGYRTTPWTIRVQINWGGNPVIRFFSVSTVGGGCVLPGYQIC